MDYKNEPNSDDDFDCSNSYNDNYGSNNNRDNNSGYISGGQNRVANPNGLSKAELRKTNKPIMEKRRRARINHCLNELKTLILEAMKKDPARHTKLEKADILEMTVKHLQSLQRQQLNMAIQTDPSVVHKFKTGFVECAEEVNRYISQLDGIDNATRQRLNNHLSNCATSLEQIGSMTNFNNGYRHGHGHLGGAAANIIATNSMPSATATTSVSVGILPTLPQDLNNNSRLGTSGIAGNSNAFPTAAIQMNGVQLIPSRLPSGELALIVPNPHSANTAANLLQNNAINSFPNWPTPPAANAVTATATATATAAAAAVAATKVPSLLDSASTLPTLNNFATQLQRMSAFTKPITHITPLTKFTSHNNNNNNNITGTAPNSTKLSMPETISIAPKTNFHTTTAAAFHQTMPHNSTATTSPPLSPISSVSSLSAAGGDDSSSLMQTSSDLTASRPTTPPHDNVHLILRANTSNVHHNSFSGVFATPPLSTDTSLSLSTSSGVSSLHSSLGSKHLQQSQVSSTSGSESLNRSSKRSAEIAEDADSSDGSVDEPASKRHASNHDVEDDAQEKTKIAKQSGNDCKRQKLQISPEDRDCMWRPW